MRKNRWKIRGISCWLKNVQKPFAIDERVWKNSTCTFRCVSDETHKKFASSAVSAKFQLCSLSKHSKNKKVILLLYIRISIIENRLKTMYVFKDLYSNMNEAKMSNVEFDNVWLSHSHITLPDNSRTSSTLNRPECKQSHIPWPISRTGQGGRRSSNCTSDAIHPSIRQFSPHWLDWTKIEYQTENSKLLNWRMMQQSMAVAEVEQEKVVGFRRVDGPDQSGRKNLWKIIELGRSLDSLWSRFGAGVSC